MQQTVAVHGGRVRLKSIPLNQVPEEAWVSLGGTKPAPDVYALYKSVPWLFAAVNIIAHAVATLPLRATVNGKPLDEPEKSYPFLSEFGDLLDAMTGDLLLFGAAYAQAVRKGRRIESVRRLHPSSIEAVYDDYRGLVGFKRQAGETVLFEKHDLAYRWLPNRESEKGRGEAPAVAALAAAGILANVDAAAGNIFANGAILPTIAVVADVLPDQQVEQLRSRIQRLVAGVKNAFSIPVISRDIEFKTVGEYPDRLAMPELTDKKREDIATVMGVPHTLLFSQAANYATARQDAYQFYDTTVIPYAQSLLNCLNPQLAPLTLETAEDELELYQAVEGDRVSALVSLLREHAITVDEVRQRAGFPELTDEQRDELGLNDEPEPEPALPEAGSEAPAQDAPPEHTQAEAQADPEAKRMVDELSTWERYTLKRLGKAGARPFEVKALHPTFAAAISGALEVATTAEQVREVFRHAAENMEYP